jgi:hypothetical protein
VVERGLHPLRMAQDTGWVVPLLQDHFTLVDGLGRSANQIPRHPNCFFDKMHPSHNYVWNGP